MLFAPSLLSLQPDLDEPKEEAGGEGCPSGQEEPTATNTGRYSGLLSFSLIPKITTTLNSKYSLIIQSNK
jgi:hypothetical protein